MMVMNLSQLNGSRFNETHEYIGGIDYVMKHADFYIPYLVFYSLGVLIGCSGNTLIMGAILCTKELRNYTNMLVFNLALADILISAFVDTFTIAGVLLGEKWFMNRMKLCEFIGAVCLIACITSLMNIWFLAMNRFVHICYHQNYKKYFTKNKTILYCIISWLIGVLVDSPNILGWGRHSYNRITLSCLWDRKADHAYTLFFPITSIIIPCCIIFVCYIKIFLFVIHSRQKVGISAKIRSKSELNQSIRIAKGLFGSFALFTLCWLPYGLVVMSDWYYTFNPAAEIYTLLIAHLNSALNPLLYAISNPNFRKGYRNFLYFLAGKRVKNRNTAFTVQERVFDVTRTRMEMSILRKML